jgi:hypothetical protein
LRITSKTGDDAVSVYFTHMLFRIYLSFQPVVKGKIDDVKKMVRAGQFQANKENKRTLQMIA